MKNLTENTEYSKKLYQITHCKEIRKIEMKHKTTKIETGTVCNKKPNRTK